MAGDQQQQPQKDYDEYRLKSTTAANVSHNVMILQSQTASFSDFSLPVRLLRDRNYDSDDDEDEEEGGGASMPKKKQEGVQAGRGRRKRTRILYLEDEDAIALREQESAPWLLEDFDGQHAFHGKLEGGQHSNYVFFVNQGNEFRVLPISRWYRFQPKLAFQPMSLEEAEAAMAKKETISMGPRASPSQESSKPASRLDKLLRPEAPAGPSAPVKQRVGSAEASDGHEDIDFTDVFDDDDEGPGGDQELDEAIAGPTAPEPTKRKVASLHGKQVKKLVRALDKKLGALTSVGGDEDEEEEEELDPYADEEDLEEIGDLIAKPTPGSQLNPLTAGRMQARSLPIGSQASQSSQPSQQSQATKATPPSRTISPALSAASGASHPALTQGNLLTEEDIFIVLRAQPLRMKELLARLKSKLKADPSNKDRLRDLVKRLAMMRPGATDDEKLVELKPEYRQ